MHKVYSIEFRNEVVALARRRESRRSQIAKDFGISETCLQEWLTRADIDDGVRPGINENDNAENRELKYRVRLLEHEAEVMRRAVEYLSRDVQPGR